MIVASTLVQVSKKDCSREAEKDKEHNPKNTGRIKYKNASF